MSDFSVAVTSTKLAMDLAQLKARVAAHNIALANTPGSRPQRVDSSMLQDALRSSAQDPSTFAQVLQRVQAGDLAEHVGFDSRTEVSLDSEVAEVIAASGRYQALADGMTRQLALLQLAISGRR